MLNTPGLDADPITLRIAGSRPLGRNAISMRGCTPQPGSLPKGKKRT